MPAKKTRAASKSKPARRTEPPNIIEEPIRVIGDGGSGSLKRGGSKKSAAKKSSKKR